MYRLHEPLDGISEILVAADFEQLIDDLRQRFLVNMLAQHLCNFMRGGIIEPSQVPFWRWRISRSTQTVNAGAPLHRGFPVNALARCRTVLDDRPVQ